MAVQKFSAFVASLAEKTSVDATDNIYSVKGNVERKVNAETIANAGTGKSLVGANYTEVLDAASLPPVVGSSFPLVGTFAYEFKALLASVNSLQLQVGSANAITSSNGEANLFRYTGSLAAIDAPAKIATLAIDDIFFESDMGAGSFINVEGLFSFGSTLRADRMRVSQFTSLGIIKGFLGVELSSPRIGTFINGLVFENNSGVTIRDGLMGSAQPSGSTSYITIQGVRTKTALIEFTGAQTSPGESYINIRPDISATAKVILDNCLDNGFGNFYFPGVQIAFTGITDISTVGAWTAAEPATGPQTIGVKFTEVGHTHSVGDVIEHTGSPLPFYNGPEFLITAIETDKYTIGDITFFGSAPGSNKVNAVRLASVGHGLSNGEEIALKNTLNYNFRGSKIFNAQANTVDAFFPFVDDVAGIMDTAGLTEADARMTVMNGSSQTSEVPRSQTVGEAILTVDRVVPIIITSFGIVAAASNGNGGTTLTTDIPHGYSGRSGIEIGASTVGSYVGFFITENASGVVFDINVPFDGDATGSVSTGVGIPTLVGGADWVDSGESSRCTVDSGGRTTVFSLDVFNALLGWTQDLKEFSGNGDNIEGSMYLNGVKIDTSFAKTDSTPTSVSNQFSKKLRGADYLDICVANFTDNTDILVRAGAKHWLRDT